MQHTVAAIQKSQWRLGFIGWEKGIRFQLALHSHGQLLHREGGVEGERQLSEKNETMKTINKVQLAKKITAVFIYSSKNIS